MTWMISTHLIDWWLKNDSHWLHNVMIMIFDPIGASGFLFISGISVVISYRTKILKTKTVESYSPQTVKKSYFIRAFIIFIIAIIYNIPVSIAILNPSYLWTWFVLLTTAISLFLGWPFLFTSKTIRILFGALLIIINQVLVIILSPYNGRMDGLGILYHILYNNISQDPILAFFPFFLIGTVIGDMLFDSFLNKNQLDKKNTLKKNFLIPTLITGILLIMGGIFLNFPDFLIRGSLSWIVYSLGIDLVLFSIFLIFEEIVFVNIKKNYKLLFYYSYYSLTVYISHNLFYFLFLGLLNEINIWFFIMVIYVCYTLLLRFIYKKSERNFSLKVKISNLAAMIAMKEND